MTPDLNLLPQEYQEAAARGRHLRGWAMVVVPAALVLMISLVMDGVRRARADDLRLTNERLQDQVAEQRAEVRRLTSALAEASLQLRRSDAIRAKRNWSSLLHFIGQAMPPTCWLASVHTDPEVPPASASTGLVVGQAANPAQAGSIVIEVPRKLRLSGFAADAVEPLLFTSNLKGQALFKTVLLERSVREADAEPARFRFDIVVEW